MANFRRYNRRIRRLPEARKLALAQAVYERQWGRNAPMLGSPGQPAPLSNFNSALPPTEAAHVGPSAGGNRQVDIGRNLMKQMLYKDRFGGRFNAKKTLAHEFYHVVQNPDLYYQDRNLPHDDQPIEQGAIRYSQASVAPIKRRSQIRRARRDGDKKTVRRLRRKPLPAPDLSQVGYRGQDPQTIRYPGS